MEASNFHRANGSAPQNRIPEGGRFAVNAQTSEPTPNWPTEVVILRASDRAELLGRADELLAAIAKHPTCRLADLGFTINTQVEHGGLRLAIVAADVAELSQKLSTAREQLSAGDCDRIRDPMGTYFESRPLLVDGKLAVLFPGEGGQYLGMLSDLVSHFPEVRNTLAESDAAVGPDEDEVASISRFFTPVGQMTPERHEFLEHRLGQLDWTMSSVLTADRALTGMLEGLELKPDALAGHSAGELAALVAAGSIRLTADLSSIAQALRDQGDSERKSKSAEALLLATAASRETLTELIAETVPDAGAPGPDQSVFIAMDNCPHQSVLVGLPEPMVLLEAALKSKRIFCERLPFSRPYHTPLFKAFNGSWQETFDGISFHPPANRLYSCTTGELFPHDPDAMRDLALAHWYSPVEFRRTIENMYASGVRVFVEAGPRGILSAFVQDILRGRDSLALPADQSRRSGITQWNHLVAQLAVQAAPMSLGFLYRYRTVEQLDCLLKVAVNKPLQQAPVEAKAVSPSEKRAAPITPSPPNTMQPIPASPASRGEPTRGPAAVVARHFQLMETLLADQQRAVKSFLQVKSGSAGARPARPKRNAGDRRRASIGRLPQRPTSSRSAATSMPSARTVSAPTNVPSAPGEFPLFGVIVRQEPGVELVMQRRLDLKEDRYANEHTVGGLDISRLNPSQRGLPVMPMTFILEMMAETASRLVPGHVVVAAQDVQLQKWLAFDEESISTVEIVAKRTSPASTDGPIEVLVSVRDLGRAADANRAAAAAVSQGTIVLARDYPSAPTAEKFELTGEQRCRVTLATLYRNLFHGPIFQGVRSLDCFGEEGLKGTIEILPREGIFESTKAPRFLIDPVTVDVGMHPTAAWHLEQPDQAGRIMLPFELKKIEFFGPSPEVGTKLGIYARIVHTSPRQFTHGGEFFHTDGKLWCRLTGIKCWRFYLPFGEVNFHGPKDEYFISTPWPIGLPSADAAESERAACMLMDPSGDLAQSGMQEAAARVTLSSAELREYRQKRVPVEERTAWLFRRAAIKDAVRTIRHRHSGERLFMADLDVFDDPYGRCTIRLSDGTRPADFPAVAVAQNGEKFVALAVLGSCAGIAIERIADHEAASNSNDEEFSEAEIQALARITGEPAEQFARGVAARIALREALGPALIPNVGLLRIRDADPEIGYLQLGLDPSLNEVFPELVGSHIAVRTTVDDGVAIASTTGPKRGGR